MLNNNDIHIHRVNPADPLPDISSLIDESLSEGFRFLQRLEDDYESESNRFSLEGEGLWYIMNSSSDVVAIGGINRQKSAGDMSTGRLRRFYVRSADRGKGVGAILLAHILSLSADHFHRIVLFTDTVKAAHFYEKHGFLKTDRYRDYTHFKELMTQRIL
ncbi:GNAT family N-acetyltransferase [Jeotgalibacillus terrae]|uniref:GNAT family N-acetyltransferase n=1 Tax=Jeotgalibacillus terrae TaxID=587735 RepID=A0ABW5ZFN5_9BACL|nr:GNAT family N-acetyltransferase [Jeotgalibacillus terrae]MBM7579410.1 GNAT superfamily N-acetyltransferase [Jeotgalibacillus terrae]